MRCNHYVVMVCYTDSFYSDDADNLLVVVAQHALQPVELRAAWPGVWVPAGTRRFSFLQHVQTRSGAHPTFHVMGTKVLFPENRDRGVELTTDLHLVLRLRVELHFCSKCMTSRRGQGQPVDKCLAFRFLQNRCTSTLSCARVTAVQRRSVTVSSLTAVDEIS
jgi:hypothetical protein